MSQITIELPDVLAHLPATERNMLIQAGVKEAVRARVDEIRQEIANAEERIQRFVARYGMTFQEFEAHYINTEQSFQIHEDYNDWFFWQQVLERNQAIWDKISDYVR